MDISDRFTRVRREGELTFGSDDVRAKTWQTGAWERTMTRSITGLSVSFSLWLAMAGTASGQAAVEYGLGAARAATTAAPVKAVGKSIGGLAGSLDKVLKAGQQSSDLQPSAASAASAAMPAAKAPPPSADTAPAPV